MAASARGRQIYAGNSGPHSPAIPQSWIHLGLRLGTSPPPEWRSQFARAGLRASAADRAARSLALGESTKTEDRAHVRRATSFGAPRKADSAQARTISSRRYDCPAAESRIGAEDSRTRRDQTTLRGSSERSARRRLRGVIAKRDSGACICLTPSTR